MRRKFQPDHHSQNEQSRQAEYDRLAASPWSPDGGNFPVHQRYPDSDTWQGRSRVKLKYQA
jgi:hypothetical protein